MKTVNFLKQEDFLALLPLIVKFAERTETPPTQHIHEVSGSLYQDHLFTLVGKDGENIVGYVCGYFINKIEFMVTQVYSEDKEMTQLLSNKLDSHLISCNIKTIVGLSKPDPKVFEKYGWRVERVVMTKSLPTKED